MCHPLYAVPRQRGIGGTPVPGREPKEPGHGHPRLPPPQYTHRRCQPQVAAQKAGPVPPPTARQSRVDGRHHKLVAGPVGYAQQHHTHQQHRPQQPVGRGRCHQAHGHGYQHRRVGVTQGCGRPAPDSRKKRRECQHTFWWGPPQAHNLVEKSASKKANNAHSRPPQSADGGRE